MSEKKNIRLTVTGYGLTSSQELFSKEVRVSRTELSRKAQSLVASAIGKDSQDIMVSWLEMKNQ